MSDPAIPRPAAATGAAAFVLLMAGLVLSVAAGRPEITMSSTSREVAAALAEPAGAGLWLGVALEAAGIVTLLVFAAFLLDAGRGISHPALGRAAFGSAVAFAAISFAALVLGGLVGDLAGAPVDLPTAVLLNDLWGGLYAASWAPCGAFLVLTGAALWGTGVLPRALLVAAVAIGVMSFAAVAAPASSAGQAIGLLPWLWFLVSSGVLTYRSRPARSTAMVRG